jgi:Golgi phosphoprotein 3
MASSGGLTRRRGGGRAAGDDNNGNRVNSPSPLNGSAYDSRIHETSLTGGENGHKIAFDPQDISESVERNKQPKLTLMEEVLLMGLKDKQVCFLTRQDAAATRRNYGPWYRVCSLSSLTCLGYES